MAALSILSGGNVPPQRITPQPAAEPLLPGDQWQAAGRQLMDQAEKELWQPGGANALAYLHSRGLDDLTLRSWQIGFVPQDANGSPQEWGEDVYIPRGILLPCFDEMGLHYLKVRRGAGAPKKYQYLTGSKPWLFGGETFRDAAIGYLFESELDVLLAWQTGLKQGFASIPAGQLIHSCYGRYFQHIDYLLVCFDNDEPGQAGADKICKQSPRFYKADLYPIGKDPTEYVQKTTCIDNLTNWLCDQGGKIGPGK